VAGKMGGKEKRGGKGGKMSKNVPRHEGNRERERERDKESV